MAYVYAAFYGIKQGRQGHYITEQTCIVGDTYFITEQTCVVGDTYDDAVTKALYMKPQGEDLIILERISPAYE